MKYIDELRKSRNKPQVAYQEFALSVSHYSKDYLYCFFEGKDNPYYVPKIKAYATEKYHPISCGGRDAVLAVYKMITDKPEYNKYKKAFFIDRDFNPPLVADSAAIFETPCYSIENFYVSKPVFEEILVNAFRLSPVSNADFTVAVGFFSDRQAEFLQAATLFNAWYACLINRRNATTPPTPTHAKLTDSFPKDFINFTFSRVSQNYDIEKIALVFPQAAPISTAELQAKITAFEGLTDSEKITTFRGKFLMQFLIQTLRFLLADANTKQQQVLMKNKINFDFGDASSIANDQAIQIFAAYAETPSSLISYLKQFAA